MRLSSQTNSLFELASKATLSCLGLAQRENLSHLILQGPYVTAAANADGFPQWRRVWKLTGRKLAAISGSVVAEA
jgi:hypothetical protein